MWRLYAFGNCSVADPRDVARDGCRDHLLAVAVDLPAARKRAIDRVEREGFEDLGDALDPGGGERDQIRVGPHEADMPARYHLQDVAREHHAAASIPVCPVQDGAALE